MGTVRHTIETLLALIRCLRQTMRDLCSAAIEGEPEYYWKHRYFSSNGAYANCNRSKITLEAGAFS